MQLQGNSPAAVVLTSLSAVWHAFLYEASTLEIRNGGLVRLVGQRLPWLPPTVILIRMPLGFHEYRVTLRHTQPSTPGSAPDFIAIVSARDDADAAREATTLVETLKCMVSIVSIERRPQDRRPDLRL